MKSRTLTLSFLVFFTAISLVSCIRTSYIGKWKTKFKDLDITYDFKAEYYEVETTGMVNDTLFKAKYKGVIYIDGQRMNFTQTMRYDYGQNIWVVDELKPIGAVFKVKGDKMTLTYDANTVLEMDRVK